ncbi:Gluconokinase [BD1-7 clade bacterium]|uniref:Gluconokinase n=1 Tax=BD1-7 clade bacterium TaxID=2029982 RepID=A0A5S9QWV5_9GAMM|nr:Gluconokinase [BD1-7 clade bacterium]CAA0121772.1 Gluconokinase [BD1-7 clade bacterium]CAA0124573.1 Gluconokinase [BD1-7 clade bacterium]
MLVNPILDLSNAPSSIFLFGLSGSGKSYVGNLISQLAGWHVYHADDDLTDAMLDALEQRKPFTSQMRDDYFDIVIRRINELHSVYDRLVITQAVYKQKHRQLLVDNCGDLEMVCVDANDTIIAERLLRRGNGCRAESAAVLRKDFESPNREYKMLVNDGNDEKIIRQLNSLYTLPVARTA